jgi:hypothetical protein
VQRWYSEEPGFAEFVRVRGGMPVAPPSHVRRNLAVLLVIALGGCEGVLREKPTGLDVDASALTGVQAPPCDPPATPMTDGHHHPGEDCLTCHFQGNAEMAPPFTFAGTLYTSNGGATPFAGATIHLIDAMGTDSIVVSQMNGNFYSVDFLTFPVRAFASQCPADVRPMQADIRDVDGSCNTTGCHTSGFRLH